MSQHGRVTKPGRQRPRVPMDERLRAPRACQNCQRSKNKCALVSSAGRQCTRCQHKSLDCSFEIGEGANIASSMFEHCMVCIDEQISPAIVGHTAQEQSPFPTTQESPSDETQRHPASAEEHLSQLLSRVREAMYGGAVLTRQEAPHNAGRINSKDDGQFREMLKQFPPKSVADFLSSCYYELATDSFFYFDQHDFQRQLDEVYLDESSRLREDGTFLCLVLMVFALGSQFANLKTKTSTAWNSGTSSCPGRYFYSVASRLLPMATFECSIRAMQTCLLTAIYLLPEHVYDKGYLFLNHALRIAISLDLHRQKADASDYCRDHEINRRLWYGGLCSASTEREIRTPLPQADSPLDDLQYFDNVSHQVANARLVLIMDSIIIDTARNTTTRSENLLRIEQQQQDLTTWKTNLPSILKLGSLRPSGKGFRTVVHLHLNFYFASILLCRSALLYLLRRDLKTLFGKTDEQNSVDCDPLERLAENCVDAARSIIGLFETLQQTESLGMFSFTDFQGCSIATVILLLESMRRGNRTNSLSIDTGFSCLRYMATENQRARLGIQYVEELRAIANQVIEKSMLPSRDDQEGCIDSRGVDAYQDWIQNVLSGSMTPSTDREGVVAAAADTVANPGSSLHPGHLSAAHGQLAAVGEGQAFALPFDLQSAAPMTTLPDDPSDTFLFGLTGLDALDFLVSDDLLNG